MQLEELILIDKLEDQIIDHPDASTKKDLNESLDETFQKKLNARAQQIKSTNNNSYNNTSTRQQSKGQHRNSNQDSSSSSSSTSSGGINYQFLITKSHLNYTYTDYNSLEQEICEWFSINDFKSLGGLNNLILNYTNDLNNNNNNKASITELIQNLHANHKIDDLSTNTLQTILYYSFGEYGDKKSKSDQLDSIKRNNLQLINDKLYQPLINIIQNFFNDRISHDKAITNHPESSTLSIRQQEPIYFIILTLMYFMINVSLSIDHDNNTIIRSEFKKYLKETDFLTSLLTFIEHWKWHPNNCYRIRYLILMVNKLIFLELGDSNHMKQCDEFLVKLHHVKNKPTKESLESNLTCSPLDYFVFRQDLIDKYPLYDETELKPYDFRNLKKSLDNDDDTTSDTSSIHSHSSTIEGKYKYFMALHNSSNSLSNLIETPKTNKSHTIFGQLPTQTVHLATPVPSPTLAASDYMSGGEKIRKSYQVNQAMPMIYPITNNYNGDGVIPLAMREADEILRKSIYESYSIKRLWNERDYFMKQERGYADGYDKTTKNDDDDDDDNDEFDYNFNELRQKYPEKTLVIDTLERIETLYSQNLCRLNTIVEVFIETIKVNRLDYNLNFAELELNSKTKSGHRDETIQKKIEMVLILQLEVNNAKELTLKATSSLILNLLKWFKISHILKSYYFSSLLFDQQFFAISLEYLSRCFNNANLQSMITTTNSRQKKDELTEYEILINQNKLMNPKISLPNGNFFDNCLCLSLTHQEVKYNDFNFINKIFILSLPDKFDSNNIKHVYISNFNDNFAHILSDILNITNKILIKNQSQRIFTFNDLKPSELYKMILINYDCQSFNKPILKTLKKLIPYQGRKWKSSNMDLISQIYLNLKLSMKDNWLSGKDLESDFNNSYDQEIALRGLLQFYNMRNYPLQMNKIGYRINHDIMNIPQLDLNDMNIYDDEYDEDYYEEDYYEEDNDDDNNTNTNTNTNTNDTNDNSIQDGEFI